LAGSLIGLADWSVPLAIEGFGNALLATLMIVLLSTPVAFFASFGRGYMLPLGFIILVLILGQVCATIGYAAYFPWTFPALITGALGDKVSLEPFSYVSSAVTSLLGFGGTLAWWRYSDQK